MSAGGNEYVEEKCAPVRRTTKPPGELPNQLKPKFPLKPETPHAPVAPLLPPPPVHTSPAVGTQPAPPSSAQPLQAQPSTPLFIPPAQPQPLHPPNAATPPPTQSPPTQSSPVLVTPPAPQASECSAPQPKENLSEKDVLPPSSDPIMAENAEGQETVQKKKKPKKPKKKENEVPGVIFLDDSEKKQKDPNNAVGQFVDETEEEDKKKKKAPRDSRRLQRAPTPRGSRGEPKTDASFRGKRNNSARGNVQKKEASSTRINAKKEERSCRGRKNTTPNSGFQKRESGSRRQKRPSASAASGRLALVKPPPQQVQKVQPAAAEVLAKGDKAAKEPNEGFFKAMYYKARQKISQMHKNPNAPASAAPNTSGDDTLVVTEATVIKTDVSAVYGQAHDYPKGIVPPKTDKNHPERLFPGGRPYWLIRDEKPPQAKVIMMGLVDQCIKDGTLKLVQQQTRPDNFTPFCDDIQELRARDEEFFLDYRRILANTVYNSCSMKAFAFGTLKLTKNSTREQAPKQKRVKFTAPTQCTVYSRKEHKKKQTVTKHGFQPGTRPKISELKKKKKMAAAGAAGGAMAGTPVGKPE